jgi:hypothetical protein
MTALCLLAEHQAPRPPKYIRPEEFQFFPRQLFDLLDRELNAFRKEQGYKAPKPDGAADDDEAWLAEQAKIDNAVPLTPEEIVSCNRDYIVTRLGAEGAAATAGLRRLEQARFQPVSQVV